MTIALITGGCGGMGRAGARALGPDHRLFLTDIISGPLEETAAMLAGEGFHIAGTVCGDLSDPPVVERVVQQARAAGPLRAVFHTAGLSPALGSGEAIWRANLIATELLLNAMETQLEPELVAVLVASLAAHMVPPAPDLEALCRAPLAPDFVGQAMALIDAAVPQGAPGSGDPVSSDPVNRAAVAYSHSKLAVIRMAEQRSGPWGRTGARIVTISPGLIDTPMGRREFATNPASAAVIGMTPLGWGQSADIADAAAFLCSPRARYITGCDLKVDGGAAACIKGMMAMGQ